MGPGGARGEPPLSRRFDAALEKVAGLSPLPWVGRDYEGARLLVVAEPPEAALVEMAAAGGAEGRTRDAARRAVEAYLAGGADWRGTAPMLDEVCRALAGGGAAGEPGGRPRASLWSRLAFMHFIQRPSPFGEWPGSGRASGIDRQVGWRATCGVIRALKPAFCVFTEAAADAWLNWLADQAVVPVERNGRDVRPGRFADEGLASVVVDGHRTTLCLMGRAGCDAAARAVFPSGAEG